MNYLAYLLTVVILAFAFTGLACAQTKSPSAAQQSDSSPAPPIPVMPPQKTVGRATANYTKNIDSMEVSAETWVIGEYTGEFKEDQLMMTAYFRVSGKKVTQPEFVRFYFDAYSHNLKYKDYHKLTIFIDGLALGTGDTVITHSECNPPSSCQETMKSPDIPYAAFLRIINAKKVEIELGPTKFELEPESLEALRDLNRIIEQ